MGKNQSVVDVQKSLVLIKPDGVRRGLIGTIVLRFEMAGIKVVAMKMLLASEERAKEHYLYEDIAGRHGEGIWRGLVEYLSEGPSVAMVLAGAGAVQKIRRMIGDTEPATAAPGTLRGDLCHQTYAVANAANRAVRNLVHASATAEEAEREIKVWFGADEFFSYRRDDGAEHLFDG